MTEKFDKLRATVLQQLKQQPAQDALTSNELIQRSKRFAAYVTACLAKMGISHLEFAQRLDIDVELANGVLDSLLPASEIDEGLIVEIAALLQRPPNVLRALLGRTLHVDQDETTS
jgi:hypothetical protein